MGQSTEIVNWRERVDQEQEFNIDAMCSFVAEGGSLVQYCRKSGYLFSDVQRWIKKSKHRKSRMAEAREIWQEMIRQGLTDMVINLARFDVAQILDDDGNVKPVKLWPEHVRAAVETVDIDENGQLSVKFTPRTKAFDMAAKISGIFENNKAHEDRQTLASLVEMSMKKDGDKDDG